MVDALLPLPAVEGYRTGRCTHPGLHALDVAAGAETFASAGQDQRFDAAVRRDMLKVLDEQRSHFIADGITCLWTVERQGCDTVSDGKVDRSRQFREVVMRCLSYYSVD